MSSIEALKESARAHEQKEEWDKALGVYKKAIEALEKEGAPDIGLYNRVADLQVRRGRVEEAVVNYEKAIDLYLEADLPNNAIGVCKKIVRNMPKRHGVYLRMGQIRGKQGLIADARQNFLTYAERMQAAGNVDEGLRALSELADVAPDDLEIRFAIAGQMKAHGRTGDAIAQLQAGYRTASMKGVSTSPFEAMLMELGAAPAMAADSGSTDDTPISLAAPGQELEKPQIDVGGIEISIGAGEDQPTEEEEETPLPTFSFGAEDEGAPLPTMGGDEDEGVVLPMFGSAEEEEEEDGTPLPMFEMGDQAESAAPAFDASALPPRPAGPADPRVITDPMGHASLASHGDLKGAMNALRKLVDASPDDVALRQKMVEYASHHGDPATLVSAWLGLAGALEHTGQGANAKSLYQQVLTAEPENARALHALGRGPKPAPAAQTPAGGFVDLGAMLLDDDEEEKTTRFVVAFEEPSGDEQADFAKMLSQFKAKVAENLSTSDVKAHQDLGTAYKEMGLLDEAISEFQQALRASADHLPTYELLGQCFMEKGEPDAAARTLTRALDTPHEIEDELLGIYYWLGRAHEQLGNKPQAVEFYDRVFSLDINFADVTERLRALR